MNIKPFRKIQTSDKDLNLIQDALKDTLDGILKCALLPGQLIPQAVLGSGSNTVMHGLGRNYVSWAWLRPTASGTLYETASPDPSKFLVIVASAPMTADLFVF